MPDDPLLRLLKMISFARVALHSRGVCATTVILPREWAQQIGEHVFGLPIMFTTDDADTEAVGPAVIGPQWEYNSFHVVKMNLENLLMPNDNDDRLPELPDDVNEALKGLIARELATSNPSRFHRASEIARFANSIASMYFTRIGDNEKHRQIIEGTHDLDGRPRWRERIAAVGAGQNPAPLANLMHGGDYDRYANDTLEGMVDHTRDRLSTDHEMTQQAAIKHALELYMLHKDLGLDDETVAALRAQLKEFAEAQAARYSGTCLLDSTPPSSEDSEPVSDETPKPAASNGQAPGLVAATATSDDEDATSALML